MPQSLQEFGVYILDNKTFAKLALMFIFSNFLSGKQAFAWARGAWLWRTPNSASL
jgi:hypothetical protein